MADLLTETVEAAYEGLNTDTDPAAQKLTAPVLENLLVDRDHVLPMRGPITKETALLSVTNAPFSVGHNEVLAGVWQFDDKLLVARANKDPVSTREPWRAPYDKASNETQLADGLSAMHQMDLRAQTLATLTATDVNEIISGRSRARFGAAQYGIGYQATVSEFQHEGRFWRRRVMWWDPTTSDVGSRANAPQGGQDSRAHLNRLFVLGGIDVPGSGTVLELSTLYFSDGGGPTADTAAKWQDDVSGLTNKIVIESEDPNDFGVALAKVGENLVIFKRRSVHVLYGYSPSTFQVRTVAQGMGCVDQRSVVECDEGVYFMSDQGFMLYDGEEFSDVTDSLHTALDPVVHQTVGDKGVDGGYASAFKTHDNYVLLSVGRQAFHDGSQSSDFRLAAMLDTKSQRWTEFSSNATLNPTPIHVGRTTNNQWIFDGNRIVRILYITTPETALESDRGFDETRDLDDFSLNSITNGLWTIDTGSGISVTLGELVPSSTSEKRLVRTRVEVADATATIKLKTGTVDSGWTDVILKRLDVNNWVSVQLDMSANQIRIRKNDGGSQSTLGSATSFTAATATNYWLRLAASGNVLTGTIYTADPEGGASPAATVAHTLSGGDATKFGSGIYGNPGLQLGPSGDTNWRWDDWVLSAPGYTRARIPAKWHSRLAKLGSPQYMTQLHRLMMNTSFVIDGAADGQSGWYVSVVGGDGRVLLPEFQLPAMGDPSSYLYRRMDVQDVFTEAADAQVRVEWKDSGGTYPAVVKAEIYEAILEYQVSRQRRAT